MSHWRKVHGGNVPQPDPQHWHKISTVETSVRNLEKETEWIRSLEKFLKKLFGK